MTALLEVRDLRKDYPAFALGPVSFSVRAGSIMGFIGRNGAGKTTTLRCLLGLVHPDGGDVVFFDDPGLTGDGMRQRVGFVSGAADFYPGKRLSAIARTARACYENWDDGVYRRLLGLFALEEDKKISQLSQGMKVKFALSLALSHHARLLILDEPTSGLDPISRVELLELFTALVQKEGVSVLFSTHITSDLEKCGDSICYIREGKVDFAGKMAAFLEENQAQNLEDIMLKKEKRDWGDLL